MNRKMVRGGACALLVLVALVGGGCSAQDWEKFQTKTSQLTGELSKISSAFTALAPKKDKTPTPAPTPDAFTGGGFNPAPAGAGPAFGGSPLSPAPAQVPALPAPGAAPVPGGFLSRHRPGPNAAPVAAPGPLLPT
jgi:hypothetical protein